MLDWFSVAHGIGVLEGGPVVTDGSGCPLICSTVRDSIMTFSHDRHRSCSSSLLILICGMAIMTLKAYYAHYYSCPSLCPEFLSGSINFYDVPLLPDMFHHAMAYLLIFSWAADFVCRSTFVFKSYWILPLVRN